jgi:hypothetical protein
MMSRPNRPRAAAANLSELEWAFLCDAVPEDHGPSSVLWGLRHGDGTFVPSGLKTSELWRAYREDVLAWWITEYAVTRPSCWWRFEAPGPRQRIGGVGTECSARLANVPWFEFGIEVSWITADLLRTYEKLGRPLGVPAVDPKNPPVFESEAEYLRRNGLFQPGEAKRLTEADFAPEPIAIECPTPTPI